MSYSGKQKVYLTKKELIISKKTLDPSAPARAKKKMPLKGKLALAKSKVKKVVKKLV